MEDHQMIKKLTVFAATAAAVAALTAAPAAADHPHHLTTPGTCVDRNGAGFGTVQIHDDNTADPGDTTFHERIHKGQPGLVFAPEAHPITVTSGLCG
jgi:hypothetical protein